MSEKQKFSEAELLQVEQQLRCPSGEAGIKMGQQMHAFNIPMTKHSLQALELQAEDQVLEIGHGNCGHLPALLEMAPGLSYRGLEISETMHEEARKLNAQLLSAHDIGFHLYEGTQIPFADHAFHKIFTVNTLYFWQDAEAFFGEIYRVLRPGGIVVVAFASKEFMRELPFVKTAFQLYAKSDFEALPSASMRTSTEFFDYTEEVISKAGDRVTREYTVAKVTKP